MIILSEYNMGAVDLCQTVVRLRRTLDHTQTEPLADLARLLAGLTAASIQGRVATGERAGRRRDGRDQREIWRLRGEFLLWPR